MRNIKRQFVKLIVDTRYVIKAKEADGSTIKVLAYLHECEYEYQSDHGKPYLSSKSN
jgi:hypothetical protein